MKTLIFMGFFAFTFMALRNPSHPPKSVTGIVWAEKDSGDISMKELLSDSVLHFTNDDASSWYKCKILSFTISIFMKGKGPLTGVPSDGVIIPRKIMEAFSKLRKGDIITFEHIKVGVYEQRLVDGKFVETHKGNWIAKPMLFTVSD